MLSKGVFGTINVMFKIGRKLGALPFEWDPKRQEVKSPISKGFLVHWYVSIAYIFVNTGFMLYRLAQAVCCMNLTYGRLFMNLFNVITWFAGCCVQINNLLHRNDMVQFINNLMKTNQYFQRICRMNSESNENEASTSIQKFTYAIYIYCTAQFFLALRTIDKNPKYFFTLTGITGMARWKIIPLALFECYMSFHVASALLYSAILPVVYVKSTTLCLETICKQDIAAVPKHFRMLQAVNNQFNLCFHSVIMPLIFFTSLIASVLTDYATIRLYDDIPLPGFLGFPMASLANFFIIIDTLPTSYKIYEGSVTLFRKTLHVTRPNGYIHKFLASCKPLSVKVGEYFIIKQITLLTFLGIRIENAIMILLTF